MHRFFVNPDIIVQDNISISGLPVHQINHVLRLKINDRIILLDNEGFEYEVELKHFSKESIKATLISKRHCDTEPINIKINLYQALLKQNKFEFILQKCTEIGVTEFIPVKCDFCVGKYSDTRSTRWKNIIIEAAEQSHRGRVPVLHTAINFKDACTSSRGIPVLAWEKESNFGLSNLVQKLKKSTSNTPIEISLFIGPEGGFSNNEIDLARQSGLTTFSLGRRILKADTAGIVTASILLNEFNDL